VRQQTFAPPRFAEGIQSQPGDLELTENCWQALASGLDDAEEEDLDPLLARLPPRLLRL
jgi:hypothetical protein